MAQGGEESARDGALTAYNWRLPPYNRRAFWHVKDILPTTRVTAPATATPLRPAGNGVADPLAQRVVRVDGTESTVGRVLADTYTDAFVVLHDGALVAEWYCSEGTRARTHALMSVTKSVVSCVAAALSDRGLLDTSVPVSAYIPELAGSGYGGATVSQVLDMRSGVRFGEDYTDLKSEVRQLALSEVGIYPYLTGLQAEAPHGQRFLYRSAETDVAGWVCERVSGLPMAELMSTLIWQPMGAEFDAEILTDPKGTAYHDGGLCATARDVARFGQLLLDGGTAVDGCRRDPHRVRTGVAAGVVDGGREVPRALRRLPRWAIAARWLVPQPVLVSTWQVRRCSVVPRDSWPDDPRQPTHAHGVREVLDLARTAEPPFPRGHAARIRQHRRRTERP